MCACAVCDMWGLKLEFDSFFSRVLQRVAPCELAPHHSDESPRNVRSCLSRPCGHVHESPHRFWRSMRRFAWAVSLAGKRHLFGGWYGFPKNQSSVATPAFGDICPVCDRLSFVSPRASSGWRNACGILFVGEFSRIRPWSRARSYALCSAMGPSEPMFVLCQ